MSHLRDVSYIEPEPRKACPCERSAVSRALFMSLAARAVTFDLELREQHTEADVIRECYSMVEKLYRADGRCERCP